MTCIDINGIPIQIQAIFGGTKCIGEEKENKSSCSPCRIYAKTLMVTFLLNNDKYMNFLSRKWEKEIFEDLIRDFNRDVNNNTVNGTKLSVLPVTTIGV